MYQGKVGRRTTELTDSLALSVQRTNRIAECGEECSVYEVIKDASTQIRVLCLVLSWVCNDKKHEE